ncbi:MAG TPA: hypothetical protein VFA18_14065 [Gemmataceae bacterium]|nr:hypothetical protein [Gemmataceae bacterium]
MRAYRDRSAHCRSAHRDFYGLIGLDFLRQFVLDFDFDRGRLAFLRRPPVSAGFAIPMLASAYQYAVPMKVAGINGWQPFIVDFGTRGALAVRHDLLDTLARRGFACDTGTFFSADASGWHQFRAARLARLGLGGWGIIDAPVIGSAFNCLGLELFEDLRLTLDFPGERLFLKPRGAAGLWDSPSPRWTSAAP